MLMAYINVAITKIDNFFRLVFSMSKNFWRSPVGFRHARPRPGIYALLKITPITK